MIIPEFNPNAWSREAAHTLCRASLDAYRDDCGELIEAVPTDTQAKLSPRYRMVLSRIPGERTDGIGLGRPKLQATCQVLDVQFRDGSSDASWEPGVLAAWIR
jgi:hypothetical protein